MLVAHTKLLEISCHGSYVYFSLCGIPGQDLLAAAESLIEARIPKPVISRLNISGMRFESRELGRQEQLKIQTAFRKLVDFLEADYFGDEMADHVANM